MAVEKKAGMLFEVSYEVCNKVGGIYTVVTSKAERILSYYKKDRYILIGPYYADKVAGEFEEELADAGMKAIFEELKSEGLICHFGKWLIKGEPKVILIDFKNYMYKTDDIKRELWDNFQVDSLKASGDYTEPVVWSYAAGKLIEKLGGIYKDRKCIAHFHEWLSGAGLLFLKSRQAGVGTVFQTHATILGRTLASSEVDIYRMNPENKCCTMELLDPVQEAYRYGIESKYLIERKSAENADVFTTVSEITGMEAEFLLKRKPDILLPNGLDIAKFPTFEEISIKHKLQRDRIREFLTSYFYPYYSFDMKQTLIYFLAGRYEFHDKGIDIYIKALGQLNKKMKDQKHRKTVIAFIWVPGDIRSIKPELLENAVHYRDVKDYISEYFDDIKRDLTCTILSGSNPNESKLFEDDLLLEIRRKMLKFKRKGLPPLSTHDLHNADDIIMNHLRDAGLFNHKDDPVKVVFYPIYLSGADGLLDLSYYEAMQGSHLGIFPSYYEPWGYTPLEAGALGVSSVTTDLAGFGRYILKYSEVERHRGIFVLRRFGMSDEDVTKSLSHIMFKFANLTHTGRVANKMQARALAKLADWSIMAVEYIKAHNLAVDKMSH